MLNTHSDSLPQALASALGLSFSGLVGLACAAAALSVAGLWALMGLTVAAGTLLHFFWVGCWDRGMHCSSWLLHGCVLHR